MVIMAVIEYFFTPSFVSFELIYTNFMNHYLNPIGKEGGILAFGKCYFVLQLFQTVSAFFLIFKRYYFYGASESYNKNFPYVHITLCIMTFLIIPILAGFLFPIAVYTQHNLWGTGIGTWMFTYVICSLVMPLWFYYVIYPTITQLKTDYENNMELDRKDA